MKNSNLLLLGKMGACNLEPVKTGDYGKILLKLPMLYPTVVYGSFPLLYNNLLIIENVGYVFDAQDFINVICNQ